MVTTTISIPIESDLARLYNTAPEEDRQKIQALLGLLLREITSPNPTSLNELMDEISDKAQARGLTPEILDSLLNHSTLVQLF